EAFGDGPPERRPRRQALARDLRLARGERYWIEEAHAPRMRPQARIVAETLEDLLHFVHAQASRHIEHDLGTHGFRARPVARFGHATCPHFPKGQPQSVDVVFWAGST